VGPDERGALIGMIVATGWGLFMKYGDALVSRFQPEERRKEEQAKQALETQLWTRVQDELKRRDERNRAQDDRIRQLEQEMERARTQFTTEIQKRDNRIKELEARVSELEAENARLKGGSAGK
jgi:septin family protein